jgi:hypothetical protein
MTNSKKPRLKPPIDNSVIWKETVVVIGEPNGGGPTVVLLLPGLLFLVQGGHA